jgi:hypothetical protein
MHEEQTTKATDRAHEIARSSLQVFGLSRDAIEAMLANHREERINRHTVRHSFFSSADPHESTTAIFVTMYSSGKFTTLANSKYAPYHFKGEGRIAPPSWASQPQEDSP